MKNVHKITVAITTVTTCSQSISAFANANNMQLATLISSPPAYTISQWYGVTCNFAYSWSDGSSGNSIQSAVCLLANDTNKWITAYSCIREAYIIYYSRNVQCTLMYEYTQNLVRIIYLKYPAHILDNILV